MNRTTYAHALLALALWGACPDETPVLHVLGIPFAMDQQISVILKRLEGPCRCLRPSQS